MLIESGGVKVEDVERALHDRTIVTATFGDASGEWADVRTLTRYCARGGISQGGVLRCLDYLAEQGRARRHPSGASFWQASCGPAAQGADVDELRQAQAEYERIARSLGSVGRPRGPSAEGITLWPGLSPELDAIAAGGQRGYESRPQ